MTIITRRLIISGRVQGVGFRTFVQAEAQKLQVDGFVRNRRDGSVEVVAAAEAGTLDALAARCRKGPPAARVNKVETGEAEGIVDKGFKHLPTV